MLRDIWVRSHTILESQCMFIFDVPAASQRIQQLATRVSSTNLFNFRIHAFLSMQNVQFQKQEHDSQPLTITSVMRQDGVNAECKLVSAYRFLSPDHHHPNILQPW